MLSMNLIRLAVRHCIHINYFSTTLIPNPFVTKTFATKLCKKIFTSIKRQHSTEANSTSICQLSGTIEVVWGRVQNNCLELLTYIEDWISEFCALHVLNNRIFRALYASPESNHDDAEKAESLDTNDSIEKLQR